MATASSPLEQLNADAAKLIYSDLLPGQIRLITVHPGPKSAPIVCELSIASHHPPGRPEYEALSYVWGSQQNLSTITVDNQILYVTRNLESALLGLRYPDSPSTLWIDALCINQTSIPERNAQVQIMHEIYENAACVIVWLGDAPGKSEAAMQFLQSATLGRAWTEAVDRLDDEGVLSVNYAMQDLCLREYWERIWVVQEIARGKQVVLVCGQYEIGWKNIMDGILLSFSAIWTQRLSAALALYGKEAELGFLDGFFHDYGPRSVEPPTSDEGNSFFHEDKKKKIFLLAVMTARKRCVDPRDKIFGIYNLLPWDIKRRVKVDYSLKTSEVFLNAAKAFIEGGKCLDIISWPSPPRDTELNEPLPSWVPAWQKPLDVTPYAFWHDHYGAKPDPRITSVSYKIQDDNVLYIKGCIVGKLGCTLQCPLLQARADTPATEHQLNEIWLYFLTCWLWLQNCKPDGDKLFLDCIGVQYKLDPPHFRKWTATARHPDDLPKASEIKLPLDVLKWLGRARQVHTFRMFFTFDWMKGSLTNGSIGWGMTSTAAKEGDLVCVLPGCLLPVLLRPVEEGKHVLVSDVYTDDGLVTDVLRGFENGSLRQEEFYIR